MCDSHHRISHALLSILLILVLFLSLSIPALAQKAVAEDILVQCTSTGVVTDQTPITGVKLPVVFDDDPAYYPMSMDVAIFSGGASVRELTGLAPGSDGNLAISLGAVTNYDYGAVYEIKYRGHYGIMGEGTEITEEWQSAGLYFKVKAAVTRAALLGPASDAFDKNLIRQADVTATVTWNDATAVTDVKNNGVSAGAYSFSVAGNILTIKKEYLATRSAGSLELTVEFDQGAPAVLAVNIIDTTPPALSPASRNYDLDAPADVTTSIAWNSAASVTGVVCGADTLTTPSAFTVNGNILTIKDGYLSGLSLTPGTTLAFTITFETGATAVLMVNVVENYTPSNDASLNDLKVGGVTVSGFNYANGEYDVELPYGAAPGSAAATVSAVAGEEHAQVNITQASVLPGSAAVVVTAEDNTTTKTYTINLTLGAAPDTHTVTVQNDGHGTGSANPALSAQGGTITLSSAPNSGFHFQAWQVISPAGLSIISNTFTMPAEAVTVKAVFEADTTGDSGNGAGVPSGTNNYSVDIKVTDLTGKSTNDKLPVTVDTGSGRASIDLSSHNNLISGGQTSVIAIPPIRGADTYSLSIPVSYLSTSANQGALTINTDAGGITILSNMLTGVAGANGNTMEVSIGPGDKSGLPEAVKTAIGDRPLIQLSMSVDGKQTEWNNPDAPVTVSIPYTPTAAELENPEHITVWYIDGSGNVVTMPDGRYDPASGMVVFTTTHFSSYAVAYEPVIRLAGIDRIETGLNIAQAAYPGKIANAVLATAGNYPDALAGSVLACRLNAPILLVGSSEADQKKILDLLKAKLETNGAVYILGSANAVGSGMEGKLNAAGIKQIKRLAGSDRYETSVQIAEQLDVKTGTPVVLVSGEKYPDALSVSSIAAQNRFPLLLVQKNGISAAVKQKIAAVKPDKVYIIGLQGVISSEVENEVIRNTGLTAENIIRIGGDDRYATSLAIAQYFNSASQAVCLATGGNFPDALAGSVYAAKRKAPIILAGGSLPDQTVNYLKSKNLSKAALFGGQAVVGKDIERQVKALVKQ